ncbi:MAG: PDZ domain-containing protein [Burkholderiales bacterium]|nr:PDZ domain-containing protein [Burkholderiales bacterium]
MNTPPFGHGSASAHAPAAQTSLPALVRRAALILALATGLGACGGGGDAGSSPFPPDPGSGTPPPVQVTATPQACAPTNPYRGDATAPTTVGSLAHEKAWLYSYMNQAYLWYGEMPAVSADASTYSNLADVPGSLSKYFQALTTPALTASGKRRDQFSFTYPTKAWNDLSQSGQSFDYGIGWSTVPSAAPWGVKVAYVEAGSPAAAAGLQRGDALVSVDGVQVDSLTSRSALYARLYPSDMNSHQLVFNTRSAVLAGATVTQHPVPLFKVLDVGGKKVGYIVFNAHMGTAEADLITAFTQLQAAAVDELVLDMRYNGGGYLYVASQLAYMIAGNARTNGKVFDQLQYNNKRAADTAKSATPFFSTSFYFDANFNPTRTVPLPTLNMGRVAVLTSADTCSASEAVINGLRGVDVDVRLIGGTTCGKPYGFAAEDNCGISYFPIEFQGVNAKGYGDYADGMSATCKATDDYSHALGDVAENQLSAALYNLTNGSCNPAISSAHARAMSVHGGQVARLLRGPERESLILTPRLNGP